MAGLLPKSRVVNVADREGDIYELFAKAAQHPQVGVLVRARHNRRLAEEQKGLWDFITGQPVAGQVKITVPRKPGVTSHPATLELRFGAVETRKKNSALKLWIVEARQSGVSTAQAICWRLLTIQPVDDLAGAVEKVAWYRQR